MAFDGLTRADIRASIREGKKWVKNARTRRQRLLAGRYLRQARRAMRKILQGR